MSPASVAALGVVVAVVAARSALAGAGPVLSGARTRRRARPLVGDMTVGLWSVSRPWPPGLTRAGRWAAAVVGAVIGGADRARRRADRDLPALLDQVTRQLRSGAALPVAVWSAAADSDDPGTVRLADELAAGAPIVQAVDSWHRSGPTPARGLTAAALSLAAEAGGSVAVVLDGVNDTLRDRIALDREVAALSSQARASAAVLVVAPMAFAGLAASADHRVAAVLFGRPLGWACLAGGALLDGAGALWMARLVGRSR